MAVIGIVALLFIFGYVGVTGYAYLRLLYGFGSNDIAEWVVAWFIFLTGIVSFVLIIYFNIDINIKG